MPQTSSAVQDQVIELVEPMTRFDRSSITLMSESHESLKCAMTWSSRVAFSTRVFEGSGTFGASITKVSGRAEMERQANQELSNEYASLSRRLNAWAERRKSLSLSNEPSLTVQDCFSGTRSFGYTYQCGNCLGNGRIPCYRCSGRGNVSCYGCGGCGTVGQTVMRQVRGVDGNYFTVSEYVRVSCGSCGGGGRIRCGNCGGSGQVQCSTCAGTGIRHCVISTQCQVSEDYVTALTEQRSEVRDQISAWPFNEMLRYGQVRRGACDINGACVQRRFESAVPLTATRLNCGGASLPFFGYGSSAKVLNFNNVVGVLLSEDLDALETALREPRSWVPFAPHQILRVAMAHMLESEVHQAICHSQQQRDALRARGIVSEEHGQDTLKALRKGMARLFRSGWAVGACLLSAAILAYEMLVAIFFWKLRLSFSTHLILLLMLIVAGSIAGDLYARWRTLQNFHAERRSTAAILLKSTGALARWRKWTAAVAVLATFLLPAIGEIHDSFFVPKRKYAPEIKTSALTEWQLRSMASQAGRGKPVMLEGNTYIRGDVSGLILHDARGSITVLGNVSHANITVDDGYIEAEKSTSGSTLKARTVLTKAVTASTLTCEKCTGTFGKDVQVNRISWPK